MRIISLNVNNFGGKLAKPLPEEFKITERKYDWTTWGDAVDGWRDENRNIILRNVEIIVDIVSDYDVVFLHEVDTNCDSWNYLKKKMNNEFKFEMPNGIEEFNTGRKSISCAFIKKCIDYECSCNNSFKDYGGNSYSRNIELIFDKDVRIVGVHMNYKKDMWDCFKELGQKLSGGNALIIGDLNVYDEETERKNVFNSLIDSDGWVDIWSYQGDDGDIPTCDTGKRIDYVLATKGLSTCGVREIIVNSIRKQGLSDHAAIIALL